MIRVCAWCEQEGRGEGSVLGEKEPYEDKSKTHTICPEHRAAVSGRGEAMNNCPGCSLCCPGCGAEKYGIDSEPHVCNAQAEADYVRYIEWPSLYIEHGGGG
jgi:hypothetical protein